MKQLFKQTQAEKQSYVNGLALFFGALLGANMGVLTDLPPSEYLKVILLLVGVVLWLQMLSAARSRRSSLRMLAALALPVGLLVLFPELRPQGLSARQSTNMVATLVVWLVCIGLIELTPLVPDAAAAPPAKAPGPATPPRPRA